MQRSLQQFSIGDDRMDDDAAKYLPELAASKVLEGFAEHGTPRLSSRGISGVGGGPAPGHARSFEAAGEQHGVFGGEH
jgi:hypothetical protein